MGVMKFPDEFAVWLRTLKKHLVFFIVHEEIQTMSIMRVLYRRRDWMRLLKVRCGEAGEQE